MKLLNTCIGGSQRKERKEAKESGQKIAPDSSGALSSQSTAIIIDSNPNEKNRCTTEETGLEDDPDVDSGILNANSSIDGSESGEVAAQTAANWLHVPVDFYSLPIHYIVEFLDMRDSVWLSMCCKEFYEARTVPHIKLQPNLLSRAEFEKWLPACRYDGVISLQLTNILLDIRNFRMLRTLKINLEMSKKLRRSIIPQITTDCLIPYINLPLIEDLSIDSLTMVPDLTLAYNLKTLFLAFRSDGPLRFKCGSSKLQSIQLASCNVGHVSTFDFPQLSASDILDILKQLENPTSMLHLRLRRIRVTDDVRTLCQFVSAYCTAIKMFTFTTLPMAMPFKDMLQLRLNLGLVAFSARCNGAAAADCWPSFWPSMRYFWPKGVGTITPFTVFSTDFAFDELNISPEDEWKKLTPNELERYEAICEQVRNVFLATYPPKVGALHTKLFGGSFPGSSLGRMLINKFGARRNTTEVAGASSNPGAGGSTEAAGEGAPHTASNNWGRGFRALPAGGRVTNADVAARNGRRASDPLQLPSTLTDPLASPTHQPRNALSRTNRHSEDSSPSPHAIQRNFTVANTPTHSTIGLGGRSISGSPSRLSALSATVGARLRNSLRRPSTAETSSGSASNGGNGSNSGVNNNGNDSSNRAATNANDMNRVNLTNTNDNAEEHSASSNVSMRISGTVSSSSNSSSAAGSTTAGARTSGSGFRPASADGHSLAARGRRKRFSFGRNSANRYASQQAASESPVRSRNIGSTSWINPNSLFGRKIQVKTFAPERNSFNSHIPDPDGNGYDEFNLNHMIVRPQSSGSSWGNSNLGNGEGNPNSNTHHPYTNVRQSINSMVPSLSSSSDENLIDSVIANTNGPAVQQRRYSQEPSHGSKRRDRSGSNDKRAGSNERACSNGKPTLANESKVGYVSSYDSCNSYHTSVGTKQGAEGENRAEASSSTQIPRPNTSPGLLCRDLRQQPEGMLMSSSSSVAPSQQLDALHSQQLTSVHTAEQSEQQDKMGGSNSNQHNAHPHQPPPFSINACDLGNQEIDFVNGGSPLATSPHRNLLNDPELLMDRALLGRAGQNGMNLGTYATGLNQNSVLNTSSDDPMDTRSSTTHNEDMVSNSGNDPFLSYFLNPRAGPQNVQRENAMTDEDDPDFSRDADRTRDADKMSISSTEEALNMIQNREAIHRVSIPSSASSASGVNVLIASSASVDNILTASSSSAVSSSACEGSAVVGGSAIHAVRNRSGANGVTNGLNNSTSIVCNNDDYKGVSNTYSSLATQMMDQLFSFRSPVKPIDDILEEHQERRMILEEHQQRRMLSQINEGGVEGTSEGSRVSSPVPSEYVGPNGGYNNNGRPDYIGHDDPNPAIHIPASSSSTWENRESAGSTPCDRIRNDNNCKRREDNDAGERLGPRLDVITPGMDVDFETLRRDVIRAKRKGASGASDGTLTDINSRCHSNINSCCHSVMNSRCQSGVNSGVNSVQNSTPGTPNNAAAGRGSPMQSVLVPGSLNQIAPI